ncbi:MAG: SPASM domain-containing protein [candidate division KSB1 bacterium]|nr:SPASM domain-containing protein [candidate division KSB1 bacterium]
MIPLIEYAKSHHLTVQVNTNGLPLKRLAEQIVRSGLDDLIISIDGPCQVHDEVRGRRGTFERVQQGLEAIQAHKKRLGVSHPLIRVRGTISPYNFDTIADLIPIAEDLNADSLGYNWTWFTTRETGEAYETFMKNVFATDAPSWRPFESDVILDPDRHRKYSGIQQQLKTLFRNKSRLPVSMSPFLQPDQVQTYYENIHETFGHHTCYAVYVKSYVLPNGDVTPCPDFPDYICGNITEQPFTDIWNGDRYRSWRRELKNRGLFPACYRCCDLFLSDVKFV